VRVEVHVRANIRLQFWVETTLASLSGFLCVLTLFWRDWIEAILRVDPDRHSGALEWVIVATLLLATAAFGALARLGWRRLASTR
jgi:hypothetical protein